MIMKNDKTNLKTSILTRDKINKYIYKTPLDHLIPPLAVIPMLIISLCPIATRFVMGENYSQKINYIILVLAFSVLSLAFFIQMIRGETIGLSGKVVRGKWVVVIAASAFIFSLIVVITAIWKILI